MQVPVVEQVCGTVSTICVSAYPYQESFMECSSKYNRNAK